MQTSCHQAGLVLNQGPLGLRAVALNWHRHNERLSTESQPGGMVQRTWGPGRKASCSGPSAAPALTPPPQA